jgi:hypothetical protein
MSDKNKSNSGGQKPIFEDNGRGLPTTGTKTPMPQVKPPKPTESSKKS